MITPWSFVKIIIIFYKLFFAACTFIRQACCFFICNGKALAVDTIQEVIQYDDGTYAEITLTEVEFDERENLAEDNQGWAEQYDADQAILIDTVFDVENYDGEEYAFLKSGKTYDNFIWILTRNDNGAWEMQTEGAP